SPKASAAALRAAMQGPPEASAASTKGPAGSTGGFAGSAGPVESARFWAIRNRWIGQRGSHTETMRDMIELHQPCVRPTIAAALEAGPPTPAPNKAEAVVSGRRRADAPTGERCAR